MPQLAHRRVLFLIPPTGSYCREDRCQSYFRFELIPSMRPPMEEAESAGALRAVGAEAFVLDCPAEKIKPGAVAERLRSLHVDLVVLVVTFGSLEEDLGWAERLRQEFPDIPIGLRGAPCFVQAEEILQRAPAVDFCVRGEYEIVFADIAVRGFQAAAGAVCRGDAGHHAGAPMLLADDLDALPAPDRTVLREELYRVRGLGVPQATVRVQRGCPYPCSYCLVHAVSGSVARHRSPESVAREMVEVVRSGIDHFYLRADTFTLDRRWAVETCRAIARLCPEARWVTTTRVDCVDDEVLAAMHDSGCYGVSFGIDVASQSIGARVGKKPDRERAREAMRSCDRHGIVSLGYFMIGFLWETDETLQETGRFLRDVRPDLVTIHFAHPYPGTRYHDDIAASGAWVGSSRAQAEPALAGVSLSAGRLQRAALRMTLRHYADPRVLLSILRKAWRLRRQVGASAKRRLGAAGSIMET